MVVTYILFFYIYSDDVKTYMYFDGEWEDVAGSTITPGFSGGSGNMDWDFY